MSKNRKYSVEELDRMSVAEFRKAHKHPVVVVLDNIRSANNVGSFFRTCDAFRVDKIFLCGITATPPNKEIHKTALGATDSVVWEYFVETISLIDDLKSKGYYCLAVEQAENSLKLDLLKKSDLRFPLALIFGNEVNGVEQHVIDACDACLEIPQWGTKHSLNVAVSAGIVLWEILRFFDPLPE